MEQNFVSRQRLKAAMLLISVIALSIICTFISRRSVDTMNHSFVSIYKDRLLPAVEIFYMNENLYGKRIELEDYLMSEKPVSVATVQRQLQAHNRRIDSLLSAFAQTYLTLDESKHFDSFGKSVEAYKQLEQSVLRLDAAGDRQQSRALFFEKGGPLFQQLIRQQKVLADIQATIGQRLMKETQSEASYVYVVTALQISLSAVVVLLTLSLVRSISVYKPTSNNFPLN